MVIDYVKALYKETESLTPWLPRPVLQQMTTSQIETCLDLSIGCLDQVMYTSTMQAVVGSQCVSCGCHFWTADAIVALNVTIVECVLGPDPSVCCRRCSGEHLQVLLLSTTRSTCMPVLTS